MSHSLDPEDWQAFRARARDMLDTLIDRMEDYSDGPVWTSPDGYEPKLDTAVLGQGAVRTDQALLELMQYGVGNTHPRFLGWVHGAGTPSGLIADMLAATMNANCGGRKTGAIRIERAVIDWALATFGLPETGSGLITSGTSMATVIALKCARDSRLGFENRKTGHEGQGLVGYTSSHAHSCLDRAFDMLGLGGDALRKIPATPDGRMNQDLLAEAIRCDRQAGLTPFVICGTAGTVNRGAIDHLSDLADLCRREDIWFHVDAAFAAALQLSETHKDKLNGLSRSDSIAFDFHKWMQVNYDAGCVLIRDEDSHRRTFSDRPDYLADMGRGLGSDMPWPVDYGPELSRGFRAVKIWAQLIEHGPEKLGAVVDANIEQARYLATQIKNTPTLELLSYDDLNICCFRYVGDQVETDLDSLNQELVIQLQESGLAAPSTTRIDGKLAIRVNITNHRTQTEDMDVLLDAILRIGRRI
ncbi:MAG: cytochrome D ubiquinol oxidase subunit I [Ponticaulis sp.]|nr:cytochrome D ubiquinol oxidase subunit I [Ponticaulis sp.]